MAFATTQEVLLLRALERLLVIATDERLADLLHNPEVRESFCAACTQAQRTAATARKILRLDPLP